MDGFPPVSLIRDAASLEASLPRLWAAEAIGFDVETTALSPFDGRLRILSLAIPEHTLVIDVAAVPDLACLKPLFTAPRPIKVAHNAKFDWRWLYHHQGIEIAGLFDTMLASQLLAALPEASLAALCRHYLGLDLDKRFQRSNWADDLSDAQLTYAATDAAVLLPLRALLKERLIAEGFTRVAALEFSVVPVVGAMEEAGVLVDREAWQSLLSELDGRRQAVARALQADLAPTRRQLPLLPEWAEGVNLNSTRQVREALGALGVVVPDTHERSLQAAVLAHPAVPRLLEYRGLQKLLSAYGEGFLAHIHPKTGRLHAHFHQLTTFTGRFSCAQPNLQNIPATEEYRGCFVAPPGHRLVVADYSQIELRILAELSGDTAFGAAFDSGLDLHRATASAMFGVPFDAVSKAQRQQAKGINFGLVYGRGAPSLASELGVEVDTARGLIQRYFETYRGVAAWLDEAAVTALRSRELRSLSGRRARFRFDDGDRAQLAAVERQAKNFPIQATSSDILKQAMAALPAVLAPFGARLVNCVHDELVVEAPEAVAEAVAENLKAAMEAAGRRYLKRVPVVAEVAVGGSWLK